MNKKSLFLIYLTVAVFMLGLFVLGMAVKTKAIASNSPSPSGSISPTPLLNREQLREQLKNMVQQGLDELKQKRADFNQEMLRMREELKTRIAAQKEQLQTRLKNIKDSTKKQTVIKIDDRINKLNEKMVAHYSAVLDKLEGILERIGKRAKKDADKGLDISAVTATITAAKEKIAVAREAVKKQAGNTYEIKITTETKLRNSVGEARKKLHTDLTAVRGLVFAARNAVHQAAISLGQLRGINRTVSQSPSPTTSPAVSPTATPTASPSPTPTSS